ncbi:hypothetical protein COL65_22230 [Priestia aryabhattai]|uniref:glycosyltransferase family 2 protein n=1 Tax=Priestia aryabhattai TaxID=412384 RepID=UPI000BF2DC74|nr:glycosyltransferase family 2 protein [Priestia aryabhattai]PGA14220.1 hypothetical protein COL65_22230 [Priestia aryabhattai]
MEAKTIPLVSVIMSVYNTENSYLVEAIESILNQTYENFEFIIIDDCTNEGNVEVIKKYKDSRINLIQNKNNLGLTRSLNKGIKLAKGKYIARMDADDISELDRFEKQINYLEENPEVMVLGGYAQILGKNKIFMSKLEDDETFKIRMMFFNCALAHPTAMINKNLLISHHIQYDESIKKSQDYMLWVECMLVSKIRVLNDVVLQYRIHDQQITIANSEEQKKCTIEIQKKLLELLIEEPISEEIGNLHYSIASGQYCSSIENYERHMNTLIKSNENKLLYDKKKFKKECYYLWLLMTLKGIIRYRDFRGFYTLFFWKSLAKINFWPYYLQNSLWTMVKEKRIIKSIGNK